MNKKALLRDAGLSGQDPDLVWRTGKPDHVGWYNASRSKSEESWRWFNGKNWSDLVRPSNSALQAAETANSKAYFDREKPIYYRTYWPKNARVSRDQGRVPVPVKKPKTAKVIEVTRIKVSGGRATIRRSTEGA